MKRAANLKYREYIRETVAEYQRRGNFIRIYPAKGSDIYDALFQGPRPYNKAVYKALFTDEVLKMGPLQLTINPQKSLDPKKND
jgi:hypothetical protein